MKEVMKMKNEKETNETNSDVNNKANEQKVANAVKNNAVCDLCKSNVFCATCEPGPLKDAKHVCLNCYQTQKAIPPELKEAHPAFPAEQADDQVQHFIRNVAHNAFADLWENHKKELKDFSKQELARVCFIEGAHFMHQFLKNTSAQMENEAKGVQSEKNK